MSSNSRKRAATVTDPRPSKKKTNTTTLPTHTSARQHSPTVEDEEDIDKDIEKRYEHPRNSSHILESDDDDDEVIEVSNPQPEETAEEELGML